VKVGTVTQTTPCDMASKTITLDVSAVGDSPSVPVSVAQTNSGGTTTATSTVLKAAQDPAILLVHSPAADGTYKLGDTIALVVDLTRDAPAGQMLTLVLSSGAMVVVSCAGPATCTSLTGDYAISSAESSALLQVVSVSGTLQDTLGNASASPPVAAGDNIGDHQHIAVDALPPAAPTLMGDASGISGMAEPGSTVTVRDGSAVLCAVTVDASGAFVCVAPNLTPGDHAITAQATDPFGNVSLESATLAFSIAATADGEVGDGTGDAIDESKNAPKIDPLSKKFGGCNCRDTDPPDGAALLLLLFFARRRRV
jgi:MYXO-CTERM domain-containing protein